MSRYNAARNTETDVAVLQVQMNNIENRVDEIRVEIKELHHDLTNNIQDTRQLLKEMQQSANDAHSALSRKISAIERWRWTLMGVGIAFGAMGFEMISAILK